MSKLWKGRLEGETSPLADSFNSSIHFDQVMYKEDILGSIAHALMLKKTGIIGSDDADKIVIALQDILDSIESGKISINLADEDIHSYVENELVKKIGSVGKMLHTARSRNDQVALDIRLYLNGKVKEIIKLIKDLVVELNTKAEENLNTVMPGYTHLQKAQPITFAEHLLAYEMMLLRDIDRLKDMLKRSSISPIGACALAGTTYPIDREFEAHELGLEKITQNSMDSVSDRDFLLEFLSAASICMMHLSRLSEEIILWTSSEFNFIELSEAFSTGSSIMPQKKNADIAELVRGKTGRVYGNLFALLTVMKGLPLAYNKDMQEDKESVFDTIETLFACLSVYAPMIKSMTVKVESMKKASLLGYMNATDLADYLTKKGMPFRDAYKLTGEIVADAIDKNVGLHEIPLAQYKKYSNLFEEDVYKEIDILNCVMKRSSVGGPAPASVIKQIKYVKEQIK